MVEIVMRKRAARAGEVGLFVETEVFEEDFRNIKMNAEVKVVATQPRSLRQLKFAWSLASKISEACDWLETRDDAMEYLLIEARHFRRIYDPLRNIAHLRPKPTNFSAMDGAAYTKLLKRMVHVAITHVVPGLDETALKAEIEAMIGPDLEPPEAAPKAKRPPKATEPEKTPPEPVKAKADPLPPQNEVEYIRAFRGWLERQTDLDAALTHFDGKAHAEMRDACHVSIGSAKMMRRELLLKFETKRET